MKRKSIIVIMLVLLSLLSCSFTVKATGNSISHFIYDNIEYSEILSSINNDVFLKYRDVDWQNETAYKLYQLTFADLQNYNNIESITDYISSFNYQWRVVNNSGETIHIAKIEDTWNVLGYSSPSDLSNKAEISFNKIQNVIDNNTLSEQEEKSMILFEIPDCHTSILMFTKNGDCIFVPFGSRPDLTGLSNEKQYSYQEIISTLQKNIDETNEPIDSNGGMLQKNQTNTKHLVIILPFVILLLFVLLKLVSKRRKNHVQE